MSRIGYWCLVLAAAALISLSVSASLSTAQVADADLLPNAASLQVRVPAASGVIDSISDGTPAGDDRSNGGDGGRALQMEMLDAETKALAGPPATSDATASGPKDAPDKAASAGPAAGARNGPKRDKSHGNATNYQMKAADHSLARPEYLAIIGGIGALLFGGAAFG